MDDQNKTNQPIDTNVVAGTTNLPIEDITPTDTPMASAAPTPAEPVAPWTAPEPVEAKPEALAVPSAPEPQTAPMQENTIAPWPAPEPTLTPVDATPLITPAPEVSLIPMPTPTVTEPVPTPMPETTTTYTSTVSTTIPTPSIQTPEVPMPVGKKKNKILPVIGGIVALLLVVGVAGAAYYVSNQLSNRQAVAPDAPTSKPLASDCTASCNYSGGEFCCNGNSCCSPGQTCNASQGCHGSSGCTGSQTYCSACGGCVTLPSGQGCNAYCNGGGGGGTTCDKGGTFQYGTYPNNLSSCDYKSSVNGACGSSCGKYTYACGIYCFDTGCGSSACGKSITYPDCDATKRDPLASPQTITFTKAGTVDLYSRGAAGTVTLTSGSKTKTFTTTQGNATKATASAPFVVAAGETYTIVVHESDSKENGKASYGWILPQGTKCGPVKTPGVAIDSNSKPTGKCGDLVDASGVINAAKGALDVAGVSAPVQCWGDSQRSPLDDTQDWDYNDFTLAFGYEKCTPSGTVTCNPDCPTTCGHAASTITTCTDSCGAATTKACAATADCTQGACMLINIYKKVGNAYGTTPLTAAQLQTLKVGDVLKFTLTSSADNLRGRFRVTIATTATTSVGSWLSGTIDATNKKLVTYPDYAVATAGNYTFDAQVSTTP